MNNQISVSLTISPSLVFRMFGFALLFIYTNQISASEQALERVSGKNHLTVQDPRYGVALWHYFQGEYLQALTELMVAEEKGGIKGHGDNPQVMKAGLTLAYGMVERSKLAFDSLANESSSQQAKNTAWYYLADIYYQHGDLNSAASALDGIDLMAGKGSDENSLSIAVKAQSLKFNILIQQGDLAQAENFIINNDLPDKAIALFNLGNAYSRQKDYARTLSSFDQALEAIRSQNLVSKEDLLLADKVNTAAGFSSLFNHQPQLAMTYFYQVQQQSLNSDLAMLGYGRAATELEKYQEALGYFGQLLAQQENSTYRPAVSESLISIPAVYEQMQFPSTALDGYESAAVNYQYQIDVLGAEIAGLEHQDLSNLIFTNDAESNWLNGPDSLAISSVVKPKQQKFSELFSENRFQADLRELQDLIHLNNLAIERIERLSMIKEVLLDRKKNRHHQWSRYERLNARKHLETYQRQHQQRREFVDKANREKDYLAFISAEQQERLKRIEDSEKRLEQLGHTDNDLGKQKNLFRVYRGMLQWQAAQEFAKNLYVHQKSLDQAEPELVALAANLARVISILSESGGDHLTDIAQESGDAYLRRIETLKQHTYLVNGKLEQKITEAKSQVFDSMVVLLESQQKNLRRYLTRARLASLRIYEEGYLGLAAMDGAQGGQSQ